MLLQLLHFSLQWMSGFLSPAQVFELRQLHRKRHSKKKDRIKAILMLNIGYSYEEIAEVLILDDSIICIEDHKVVVHESNMINAQSTIALFSKMLKKQPVGKIHIILDDNAGYYRSKEVQEFLCSNKRIRLIFIPPYSPNLNIIERLWKLFKKHMTYNTYYEKFAVFRKYCLDFFNHLKKYKPELQILMTDNFQLIQA